MLETMELPVRRGLALTFTLLFVFIALISIAYGRGYRIDVKNRRISLTGVIVITGNPRTVKISIDGRQARSATLPMTARGVLPGDHTIVIGSPEYGTQNSTISVRPSETAFFNDLQLIQTNPESTLRTGIPLNAKLSPYGGAIAWIEKDQVIISPAKGNQHTATIAQAKTLQWSDDGEFLNIFSDDNVILEKLNRSGVRIDTKIQTTSLLESIQKRTGKDLPYTSVQKIADDSGWFLIGDDTAWLLPNNTDAPILFSRWYEPIVKIVHLGRKVTATIRDTGITVRNTGNGQVTSFSTPKLTSVTATKTPGAFQALVSDGDLLRWVEYTLF